MMDVFKIRPRGPWVLLKVDPPRDKEGSIFVPQGNLAERMGHITATVLRVGDGYPNGAKKIMKTGRKFDPPDVKEGDRVTFRGYLQEANRLGILDREHCLLHLNDIIGVIGEGAEITDGSSL